MDKNPKQQIVEKIKSSTNILVTVSDNPNVDELSAAIGLALILNKLDKHATAVFSGEVPKELEFLKPSKTLEDNTLSLRDFIISLDKEKADKLRYKVEDSVVRIFITPYRTKITKDDLKFEEGDFNVDLVLALGVTNQDHLDGAIKAHGRILHDASVATINAGGVKSSLGSIDWHDPEASCLCEMLVSISEALKGGILDKQMSTALLSGIVFATERFSNGRTTPKIMTMAAQLMAAGADQQLISTNLSKNEDHKEVLKKIGKKSNNKAEKKPDGSKEIDLHHDDDATNETEVDFSKEHKDEEKKARKEDEREVEFEELEEIEREIMEEDVPPLHHGPPRQGGQPKPQNHNLPPVGPLVSSEMQQSQFGPPRQAMGRPDFATSNQQLPPMRPMHLEQQQVINPLTSAPAPGPMLPQAPAPIPPPPLPLENQIPRPSQPSMPSMPPSEPMGSLPPLPPMPKPPAPAPNNPLMSQPPEPVREEPMNLPHNSNERVPQPRKQRDEHEGQSEGSREIPTPAPQLPKTPPPVAQIAKREPEIIAPQPQQEEDLGPLPEPSKHHGAPITNDTPLIAKASNDSAQMSSDELAAQFRNNAESTIKTRPTFGGSLNSVGEQNLRSNLASFENAKRHAKTSPLKVNETDVTKEPTRDLRPEDIVDPPKPETETPKEEPAQPKPKVEPLKPEPKSPSLTINTGPVSPPEPSAPDAKGIDPDTARAEVEAALSGISFEPGNNPITSINAQRLEDAPQDIDIGHESQGQGNVNSTPATVGGDTFVLPTPQ